MAEPIWCVRQPTEENPQENPQENPKGDILRKSNHKRTHPNHPSHDGANCNRRDHGPFLQKIDQYFCRDNGRECDYRAEQYRTNHSEARGPIPNSAHQAIPAPALANIHYIIGRPPEIKIRNRIAPWRDHSLTIDGIRPENSGSHRTRRWREMDSNLYGAFP